MDKPADNDRTFANPKEPGEPAATITPPPARSNPGSTASALRAMTLPSQIELSISIEDLLDDRLLTTLPRTEVNGRSVPSLGGIALIAKLGQGGMGAVYHGVKLMLRQEVAVKVLPLHLAAMQPQFAERFVREAQLAASIESPHLVRVSDVNETEGLFYLVMELVRGMSSGTYLKRLTQSGRTGLAEAAALDLCIAATSGLAAAHARGVVHRDIKPDNIMLPKAREGDTLDLSAAKVTDLGLAKREELSQSLTGTQAGMGTPGYMAPEQAYAAHKAGKRSDVFGMAATLYALLAGHAPFRGESPTGAMIATIQDPHVPIRQLRPDVSEATEALLDRCLAKAPEDRFCDASALLEGLRICRSSLGSAASSGAVEQLTHLLMVPEVGVHASAPPPVNPGVALPVTTVSPALRAPWRRTPWIAAAVIVVALITAVSIFLVRRGSFDRAIVSGEEALSASNWTEAEAEFSRALLMRPGDPAVTRGLRAAREQLPAAGGRVSFGIAHSNDKTAWIRWAAGEYAKTEAGKRSSINLIALNVADAQKAILAGDRRIHVWSPSSGILRRALFVREWKRRQEGEPFVREETLALTPQVFVMYEDRYQALVKRYGSLSFETIHRALAAGEWATIARKKEWGPFTFAITDPARYNHGLAALTLMNYELAGKIRDLTVADVTSNRHKSWVEGFKRAFDASGSPEQTLREMVLKGPSAYDGICTYEGNALTQIENAEDRWGAVRIVYPPINIWNDSSYYILRAPGSSEAQRKAASDFLDFLLSEPVQKKLVIFGYRPANADTRIRFPESPFVRLARFGVKTEIPVTVEPPRAEVLEALVAEHQPHE